MKLFKKLAAAVLVAALALTMVGCGAGGTGSAIDLKNEVLNVIEDSYCADHTAMDAAAAALIEKAAADEAAKDDDVTVKALLKKQTIDGNYIAIFKPYGQLSTELMQYLYIGEMEDTLDKAIQYIANEGYYNNSDTAVKIGSPVIGEDDSIEIGAATGKIKDKNYLVLLVKKAEA